MNNGVCQPVGKGYYSPNQSNDRYQCPNNTSTNTLYASNSTQCICNPGLKGPGGGPCEECSFNHKCTGGSEVPCDSGEYSLAGSSSCTECAIKFHYGNGVQYTRDANLSEGNDQHADWEITSGRSVCSFYLYKHAWWSGDCDNYIPGLNVLDRPIPGVGGEVTSVMVRSQQDNSVTCTNPDGGSDCAMSKEGSTCS